MHVRRRATSKVSEDGGAAHDEYDHGHHHVELTYYPMAFKEGGRHAVRRSREPDHCHRYADEGNSEGDIHDRSPAIAASKCSRRHIGSATLLTRRSCWPRPWRHSVCPWL